MILYFTGTGNSRFVAEALGDRLEDEVVDVFDYIRRESAGTFESITPWVFVCPVYLSTVVRKFADFIRKSEFKGNHKAYFVATCASAMGSAPNDCMKIAADRNLVYMGTARVQMPQNYIALFTMTPADECERRYEAALKEADVIASLIQKEEPIPGKKASAIEYRATKIVESWYYKSFTKTRKFYAADSCVGCGLCEKNCPTGTITLTEGKPKWTGTCIHCMACINSCPKASIEYGKKTASKPRYICKKYKD